MIFFASVDVLSGLFTLANYDWAEAQGVIAPMGSVCSCIVNYPMEESFLITNSWKSVKKRIDTG